jgi:type VI secretion system secreted protein Hcp
MAVDLFLKIDGIAGESVDKTHKGEIELESFSWGETNEAPAHPGGTGGGAGRVKIQDLHVVAQMNKASPTAGKGQQEFLIFKFNDLIVSSYQTGGSAQGDTLPTDQVSFNFGKIQMEYKPQQPDGTPGQSVKAGWDVQANQPI